MNTYEKFQNAETINDSILCVGLDTILEKIPEHLRDSLDGILSFNLDIIEATSDLVSSYKINFAFYEQYGLEGISILKKTIDAIPKYLPVIADAKRGDIGNTSRAYAKAAYEAFNCDAVTVSPYMGHDSVKPFLEYPDKMTIILALTSNPGSEDFEKKSIGNNKLYEEVVSVSKKWGRSQSIGYVVGATHPGEIKDLREITDEHYFLIPGIGAQGGSPEEVMKANGKSPAIINSSRSIIYAGGNDENYYEHSRTAAMELRDILNKFRK